MLLSDFVFYTYKEGFVSRHIDQQYSDNICVSDILTFETLFNGEPLLEVLPVLVTICPAIFWETVQMRVQEMELQTHIHAHVSKRAVPLTKTYRHRVI